MERIVNTRLIRFLENHGLLQHAWCGYGRHHSTIEQLVFLENSFIKGFEHVVLVFFDLEKTFNKT